MKVSKVVKNEDGLFSFDGELTEEELDIVVTVGMGFLMTKGALSVVAPGITITEINDESVTKQ